MAKPSLPTSEDDRARGYLNVLFEMNARLRFIKPLKSTTWAPGITRQVVQLQLRHICELTAIGCLVIQGDYTSSRSFQGDYDPQKVFRGLEKRYGGFFPLPAIFTKDAQGNFTDIRGMPKPEAMTRKEMEALWHKTGAFLHRLRISNFFQPSQWAEDDIWPEIDSYVAKIEALLNPHIIAMHSPKILVAAGLYGDNGKPNLTFVRYGDDLQAHLSHFHGRGETPYWRAH